MYTIVGSGFGLYGYLPALARTFPEQVLLPEKYRAAVEARAELQPYLKRVQWVADPRSAITRARGIVIATQPEKQPQVVADALRYGSIDTWFLEKPLAPTPAAARAVLERLAKKRYRVGYTLLHTDWAQAMARGPGRQPFVTWRFLAHHFTNDAPTWKRASLRGGGVLRFYAIHVIALLAQWGYDSVVTSTLSGRDEREPECWKAQLTGTWLAPCAVEVDSRSAETCFRVGNDQDVPVNLKDPFEASGAEPGDDRRVPVVERLLQSAQQGQWAYGRFARNVNSLWAQVESASTFEARG